jgi:nicotinate-nucleotide pyrophosphorylase (carboxylating)
VILLDNMSPAQVRTAVEAVGGRAITEASGSIRLDNVRAYAEAGVDMISTSALTSTVRRVDLSLELEAD